MKSTPCLECPMKNEDKNNSVCLNCDKRIRYVRYLQRSLNYCAAYDAETFDPMNVQSVRHLL
jgi:hypothetical protein